MKGIIFFCVCFILVFAVISIILIQDGDTRDYLRATEIFDIISSFDFEFENFQESVEDLTSCVDDFKFEYANWDRTYKKFWLQYGENYQSKDFDAILSGIWEMTCTGFWAIIEGFNVFFTFIGLIFNLLFDSLLFVFSCTKILFALLDPVSYHASLA